MGRRQDLRKKRRLDRLIKRTKIEREQRKIDYENNQAIQAEIDSANNEFESSETYYALFGVVLSIIALIDWLALSTFHYEVIAEFSVWKSLLVFIIYTLVAYTLIPKSGFNLFRLLIGLSIVTFPLLIISNTVFSGVYEQGLLQILLNTAILAPLLSCLIYLTHFSKLNGLWLIAILMMAIPMSVYSVNNWSNLQTQPPIMIAASIFGLIVGYYWAGCTYDYPRTWQKLTSYMITIHVRLMTAAILILTNLWVILFLL
ncbi:MAG: hypothetical protein CMG93_15890 [Marinomonas sp.]|nr:hypothetical protein [Marinomonas sp.]